MIRAENLNLTLNKNRILDGVSFEVPEQETLVIMGKNGCGKTMLLKTLVGLVKPQSGRSIIDGKSLFELKKNDLDLLRKNIGYVFQQSGLFDSMSIAENVVFPVRRFFSKTEAELRAIATDCLNRSGLKDAEDKLPSELSGGMRKRAGIARSIALNPKYILMDDPAAGLDPVLTDAIANLIIGLRNDFHATFIVITHDLHLAYKLADRIALMVSGRIHSIVGVEEFKHSSDPFIEQFREGRLTGPIPVIE